MDGKQCSYYFCLSNLQVSAPMAWGMKVLCNASYHPRGGRLVLNCVGFFRYGRRWRQCFLKKESVPFVRPRWGKILKQASKLITVVQREQVA